jgi:hypothetical protein
VIAYIQLNFWFREILKAANRKLEEGENAFEARGDQVEKAARLESTTLKDAREMQKGFRFLV